MHLDKDPAIVKTINQTCGIAILTYFTIFPSKMGTNNAAKTFNKSLSNVEAHKQMIFIIRGGGVI